MTHATPSNPLPGSASTHPSRAVSSLSGDPFALDILLTHIIPCSDPAPLSTLRSLLESSPTDHWLLTLSYDLGPTIERSVPSSGSRFPHIIAQRCAPAIQPARAPDARGWSIDPTQLTLIAGDRYRAMVRRAKDYIGAGDIYQVNLTHPITIPFSGSSAALAGHLFTHATPAMGSFTCFDSDPSTRHAIISLSPETFLTYDAATRVLTTEPMKGTRPASSDPRELRDDPKDRAELNMIIDLMRNDLGRLAVPGSVVVTDPRRITLHHHSVHQATATIRATLRPDLDLADILGAAFPPGSITGAPKVRAMQIIHELETSGIPRGPYCGSTLTLEPNGSFRSSVNIRTLHIIGTPSADSADGFERAILVYHTGAGIVADSDPESEWVETLTKAAILESGLGISLPADSQCPLK